MTHEVAYGTFDSRRTGPSGLSAPWIWAIRVNHVYANTRAAELS